MRPSTQGQLVEYNIIMTVHSPIFCKGVHYPKIQRFSKAIFANIFQQQHKWQEKRSWEGEQPKTSQVPSSNSFFPHWSSASGKGDKKIFLGEKKKAPEPGWPHRRGGWGRRCRSLRGTKPPALWELQGRVRGWSLMRHGNKTLTLVSGLVSQVRPHLFAGSYGKGLPRSEGKNKKAYKTLLSQVYILSN